MVELVSAELERDRDELIAINVEYLSWVGEELHRSFAIDLAALAGMPIADYVVATIDKVIDPRGAFYLLRVDGALAGMGGWRPLEDGVAEIKRMYVAPALRRRGLGWQLLEALETKARQLGYARIRLDTGARQPHVRAMYERAGYHPIENYNGNAQATFWGEKILR